MSKDPFDDFMSGFSGGSSRLANAVSQATEKREDIEAIKVSTVTTEQKETLLRNRSAHRGRGIRVEDYKSKTFRISVKSDDTMTKIAAVSGKPFKELLDEAVIYLAKQYNVTIS